MKNKKFLAIIKYLACCDILVFFIIVISVFSLFFLSISFLLWIGGFFPTLFATYVTDEFVELRDLWLNYRWHIVGLSTAAIYLMRWVREELKK